MQQFSRRNLYRLSSHPQVVAVSPLKVDTATWKNPQTGRRRAIFILARVEEVPHSVIAQRFQISSRMVEKELSRALEHCAEYLGRNVVRRFGPRRKILAAATGDPVRG